MTSVLILQPYTEELWDTPVMYLIDRPLFAEDRETGETRHVYGVTQGSHHRPSTVMSIFAFQDMTNSYRMRCWKPLHTMKEAIY